MNNYASTNNNAANSELLNRGVNPYPGCLTMYEARRLVDLMGKPTLTDQERGVLAYLQAKIEG